LWNSEKVGMSLLRHEVAGATGEKATFLRLLKRHR
jgi:hypothetical protein